MTNNRRRQDVGAKIEAVLLVAVVLFTGYLVGAVASGAVSVWWHTTVGGAL